VPPLPTTRCPPPHRHRWPPVAGFTNPAPSLPLPPPHAATELSLSARESFSVAGASSAGARGQALSTRPRSSPSFPGALLSHSWCRGERGRCERAPPSGWAMLASEHLRRKLPTRPCYGEEQAAADTFIVMNVTSSDVGASVSEASECVLWQRYWYVGSARMWERERVEWDRRWMTCKIRSWVLEKSHLFHQTTFRFLTFSQLFYNSQELFCTPTN
jgi:hypothetical protein